MFNPVPQLYKNGKCALQNTMWLCYNILNCFHAYGHLRTIGPWLPKCSATTINSKLWRRMRVVNNYVQVPACLKRLVL